MRRTVRTVVPVLLVLGATLGLWLVFAGGTADDSAQDDPDRLSIGDTDLESIAELAGITLPESTDGFLSARLDDDSQLDVTFTIDPADESAFTEASELPEPVADQRVITHSSPLWDLNAEGTIRGASDTTRGADGDTPVGRAVEFTDEDGLTRVRLVLTASPQPR